MTDVRNQLLNARKKVGSGVAEVEIGTPGGSVEVEVCRPGLEARDKVQSVLTDDSAAFSTAQAICVVRCLREEEFGDRVFDDADAELLADGACGDWFDDVAQICMDLAMPPVDEDEQGN